MEIKYIIIDKSYLFGVNMYYQQKNSVGKYFFEIIRYKDFYFEQHLHRHYELIYVREGATDVKIGNDWEKVSEGECAFIPSNTLHSYKTDETSIVDVCVFSADFIPVFFNEIRQKRPNKCKFTCSKHVLDYAKNELFNVNKKHDVFALKSVLYALAGEILKCIKFTKSLEKTDVLFDKLLEYVSVNFKEDISLDTASKELGYEKHYLSRCFHQVIPMNFSKYINTLRVDFASELLQNTDMSITEIALESGFQSIRNFNRVFCEVTGKTPREFSSITTL
ncbi:MAG: helix-turn-helix domain-containing protein [Clostridiales bacterium]|nr:helix-turn-helix domain-containing protein [Clostridiales bacterium]